MGGCLGLKVFTPNLIKFSPLPPSTTSLLDEVLCGGGGEEGVKKIKQRVEEPLSDMQRIDWMWRGNKHHLVLLHT